MCTAPTTAIRSGGLWTPRNHSPSNPDRSPTSAAVGRRPERVAGPGDQPPLPGLGAHGVDHRLPRRPRRDQPLEQLRRRPRADADRLDHHPDPPAAGEPDREGLGVADPEVEHPRPPVVERLERLGDHRALDAAARDRAGDLRLAADRQLRPPRPRRRAPGLDDGGERRAACRRSPRRAPPRGSGRAPLRCHPSCDLHPIRSRRHTGRSRRKGRRLPRHRILSKNSNNVMNLVMVSRVDKRGRQPRPIVRTRSAEPRLTTMLTPNIAGCCAPARSPRRLRRARSASGSIRPSALSRRSRQRAFDPVAGSTKSTGSKAAFDSISTPSPSASASATISART